MENSGDPKRTAAPVSEYNQSDKKRTGSIYTFSACSVNQQLRQMH